MTDLLELRTLLAKATPPVDGNKILIDRALLNRLPDLLDEVEKLRTENRALLEVAEAARPVFDYLDRNDVLIGGELEYLLGPLEDALNRLAPKEEIAVTAGGAPLSPRGSDQSDGVPGIPF